MWILAYQADDASGSLLVTKEEQTPTGLGGPGNVVVGSLGRLLSLLVVSKSLRLDGIGAKEEELLGGNQVPKEALR